MSKSIYGALKRASYLYQQALVDNGICAAADLPASSTISDIVRKDLDFTWKKITVRPEESQTNVNIFRTLQYITFMATVDPLKVHFFDEASVISTTPNRTYGHSKKGQPAIEVKRYASNRNYTINLLHSRFGIDNFNILQGASNGLEMLHFFQESLKCLSPL